MSERKSKALRKSHQETRGNSKAVKYSMLANGQIVADSNHWLYQCKKGRRVVTPKTRVARV